EHFPARAHFLLLPFGELGLAGLSARLDRIEEELRRVEDARAHLRGLEPGELTEERLVTDTSGKVVRTGRLTDPLEQLEPESGLSRTGAALHDERPAALPAQEGDDLRRYSPDSTPLARTHAKSIVHGRNEGPGDPRTIPCPVPSWAQSQSKAFAR